MNLRRFLKFNSILQLSSTLICMSGLIYQTYLLYEQYAKRNTVVHMNIGRIFDESLPAITICYYPAHSFERLAKTFSQFEPYYTNYLDVMLRNKTLDGHRESKLGKLLRNRPILD